MGRFRKLRDQVSLDKVHVFVLLDDLHIHSNAAERPPGVTRMDIPTYLKIHDGITRQSTSELETWIKKSPGNLRLYETLTNTFPYFERVSLNFEITGSPGSGGSVEITGGSVHVSNVPPFTDTKVDDDSVLACQICFERRKIMAFQCGHVFCGKCGSEVDTCPNCREAVQHRTIIYIDT